MEKTGEKEVLLDKLIGVQDIEAAKQPQEMDTDLIAECSGYILELTGEKPPPEHVLEQMKQKLLRRLFGRGRVPMRRKGLLRKLLIAAIVAILIVAMSVSMMPLGTNDESLMQRWGFVFLHKDSGYSVDFGDYLTLIRNGESKDYKTIRQFIRSTRADVLVPTKMPKGVSIQKVSAYFEYISDCPVISLMTNDPSTCSVQIYLGKEIDLSERVEKPERIGEYDCAFTITPGWCQCDFNYNGNGYTITAKTKEELTLILNNMKGSLEK